MGLVTLVAISSTSDMEPYHLAKSLQLIWRSGTFQVPDLQMSCTDKNERVPG